MRKAVLVSLVIAAMVLTSSFSYAARNRSSDILKQGLLGAGSGAVGGLASGAKGGDVWKGALAGAGVNIVGGALLDSISGEQVSDVDRVDKMGAQDAYSSGYSSGFNNGYKQGYTQGYKEGLKEALQDQ